MTDAGTYKFKKPVTTVLLDASIELEQTKTAFHRTLIALDAILERVENRDVDTVEQFLEDVQIARLQGLRLDTFGLEQWLETETNK